MTGEQISFLIAAGGWVVVVIQFILTQREKRQDTRRLVRQQNVDRVKDQLDAFAELEDLYRLLANEKSWQVHDENGRPIVNPDGTHRIETHTFYPEPDLEQALSQLEETQDINSAIALQVVRIHRKQSQTQDLIHDLEPTGRVRESVSLLYYDTVIALKRAIDSGDFSTLIDALEKCSNNRRIIRDHVNQLVDRPDYNSTGLLPLPTI